MIPAAGETPARGVTPAILLTHIRNTAPFLFEKLAPALDEDPKPTQPHLKWILETDLMPEAPLSHFEYFRLCLAAHHATVATFVPTDVDNQIRFRLWSPALDNSTVEQMANLVLESIHWDFRPVSTRWVRSPSGELLSGHYGEWFSTAAGAYAALRRRNPDAASEMGAAIVREVKRESSIYTEFRKARDGISALKAATAIAHNLGDLIRVLDMWKVAEDDPLRFVVETATLNEASALNKQYMADENHRHFALRKPKGLRRSPDMLLPFGPFFDGWGSHIARHPALKPEEIGEIAEVLVDGWEWLQKNGPKKVTLGYPRALAGILEAFPGGLNALSNYLPARVARTIKSGDLRNVVAVPRARFESQWNQFGLK